MVTEAEVKAISQRVAEPMRKFAASIVAPIYWPARDAHGSVIARNGTAFFYVHKQHCSVLRQPT